MRVLPRRRARPAPDEMSVGEHLAELRQRVVRSLGAFAVGAIIAYLGYNGALRVLREPLCAASRQQCRLYLVTPLGGFAAHLDFSGYAGLVLASPVILFEFWRFVTPGLRASERRYALAFVTSAVGLFGFGAYLAWLVYPHALGWLISASGGGTAELFTPQSYLNLLYALMAIFGLTFEFPVVLVALELAGVIRPAQLRRHRRL